MSGTTQRLQNPLIKESTLNHIIYSLIKGFWSLWGAKIGSPLVDKTEVISIFIWEFPTIGGTLFWGPYNKDPTI